MNNEIILKIIFSKKNRDFSLKVEDVFKTSSLKIFGVRRNEMFTHCLFNPNHIDARFAMTVFLSMSIAISSRKLEQHQNRFN